MCGRLQKKVRKGVAVKLDLEKAYEKTDWSFLNSVIARKRFGAKWRS